MTCTSQIPFTIDGCTEMGFAFAAVPASDGGDCGKCYQLTFTGKGKYSTDDNHRYIKGKKLIIMTTNIGGDVQQGQFDIMIPGQPGRPIRRSPLRLRKRKELQAGCNFELPQGKVQQRIR